MRPAGVVVLTKEAPKVSLDTHGVTSGLIKVQLNWTSPRAAAEEEKRQAQGLWRKLRASARAGATQDVDLDLGCMIEFRDGRKSVVQALGNLFGASDQFPYVALDGDDRTGARTAGENMAINLNHQAEFSKLLLYVYIYEGSADFSGLDAVVTLTADGGDRFEVHLDECPPNAHACAIALIRHQENELVIDREVRWFTRQDGAGVQKLISEAYDFGIQWKPARK